MVRVRPLLEEEGGGWKELWARGRKKGFEVDLKAGRRPRYGGICW